VTSEAALAWFGQVVALVGTVAMLVYLDWRLFLVGLVAMPPALWALLRYRRELEDRVRVLRERSADIGTFLIETLQGMRTVVGANAQEREVARFRGRTTPSSTRCSPCGSSPIWPAGCPGCSCRPARASCSSTAAIGSSKA
jgi:ABC-type multidrug transport system fused ATPase/permease subunit